ncbi:uncharacterized protein BDR25DRAFT_379698 [Lindgomyces ingoldianus]|uniref:Uncharacterized protein n=1 Tax=Lindgomyces ingoldianus TaxID=673940 RepID=A0ACB6R9N4_9PLEO|nr:uncharacterized protein BDR25DRAFT_379698 [Lindgomyces ingoldianus]KAF2476029.1 hypothetical protein BDR25DRAFT_379698 [Lindgomyces ingoldianus]
MACRPLLRIIALYWLCLCARAAGPYQSLGDIFNNQLAHLEQAKPTKNPYLGGQNFGYCCRLAVNESLEIIDGQLQFKPGQIHLSGNISTFLQYQFPCGASYNGSQGQPRQVWVTWRWCNKNCPGWEISKPERYSFWIQPLVAFIIPSVVFCLSIPRRRRIQVPDVLFPRNGSTLSKAVVLPLKATVAFIIVALDILIWLATVLALAGPMLISGIFEAVLDLRVITLLVRKRDISLRDQARLLYAVLIGNLDQSPAWGHMNAITQELPSENYVPAPSVLSYITTTKARLKSMLESQYSFGSTVGAAIIFFMGGFIFALIEIQSTYGISSTAHRLAFGMFWMIIPHVAIVSSVLLAGNNPSSWNCVASQYSSADLDELSHSPGSSTAVDKGRFSLGSSRKWLSSFYAMLYQPSYQSIYHSASLWNRGTNKAMWLSSLSAENSLPSVKSEVLHLGTTKWLFYCIFPAMFLLVIPSLFGIMISYVTPVVGISCRSGAILVYVSAQILLTILWIVDVRLWKRDSKGEFLTLGSPPRGSWAQKLPWYILGFLGVLATFFFSILSTIFTFINLYVNCLCFFPIWHWWDRYNSNAQVYLGSNSDEKINNARRYWTPCGLSATAFLVAAAYIGWWYQRRLRAQFRDLVDNLGTDTLHISHRREVSHQNGARHISSSSAGLPQAQSC